MALYVRQTIVEGDGLKPISWSKLNSDCEKRMVAVQYVFTAGQSISGEPLVLRAENFSESNLKRLLQNPAIDVKGIGVYGTLGARQQLLNYNKTPASGRTIDIGWSTHFITLINVEGVCKIVDLSIGDEPVDIETWLSGFFNGTCKHEDDAVPDKVGNCIYSILEPFTAAILNDPKEIPAALNNASKDFIKELANDFDVQASAADLPWYLTGYTAIAP